MLPFIHVSQVVAIAATHRPLQQDERVANGLIDLCQGWNRKWLCRSLPGAISEPGQPATSLR